MNSQKLIEEKRREMIVLAEQKHLNLVDPAVIKISQELDALLVTNLKEQLQVIGGILYGI